MFDKNGNYSPPDQKTPHVAVAVDTIVVKMPGGAHTLTVPKGTVTWAGSLGATQIGHISPRTLIHPRTREPLTVIMEHPTATVGDILPADEVAAGAKTAAEQQAEIAAYRAAQAANPPPAGPTLEQRVAALEAKASAKPE